MNIYFSHGKESSPNSTKIQRLSTIAEQHSFVPIRVDYTDSQDPVVRANKLRALLKSETQPFLLVGSSMGGYVSMICASEFSHCQGVFLLAPALFMPHYSDYGYAPVTDNIVIVHGSNDEIVPVTGSEAFAEQHANTLHIVEDGHRLIETLPQTEQWFDDFLTRTNVA